MVFVLFSEIFLKVKGKIVLDKKKQDDSPHVNALVEEWALHLH